MPGTQVFRGSQAALCKDANLPKSFPAPSATQLYGLSSYCQHRPKLERPGGQAKVLQSQERLMSVVHTPGLL